VGGFVYVYDHCGSCISLIADFAKKVFGTEIMAKG
jgi:hypothetical protein